MIRRRFGLGRLCSGCRVATRVPYSGRSRCFGCRIHRLTLHLGDLAHGLLHTGLHFSDLAVYDVEILGAVRDVRQHAPQLLKHADEALEFVGFRIYFE